MKRYLILAESERCGYFVEIHTDIEAASRRMERFFELAFNPPTDKPQLYKEFKILGNYVISEQYAYFFKEITCCSNGMYSTYVVEIDENFSFHVFRKMRENTRHISYDRDDEALWALEEKYGADLLFGTWAN